MDVLDSFNKLSEDVMSLTLGQLIHTSPFKVFKKVTTFHVFGYDVDLIINSKLFYEREYVGVFPANFHGSTFTNSIF